MEKLLEQLVERLKKGLDARLKSVILYGSAAEEGRRDKWSDLNVFCVLDEVDRAALEAVEPVVRWWREKLNPAPLLMSEAEISGATDCFPIEFHDMLERRRVLQGKDVIAGLAIDDVFYRAQVEHELRAKQIRLRQKAAAAMADGDLLIRLMAESLSTFLVLSRHALRLAGKDAPFERRALAQKVEEAFGADARAFYTLLSLREGTQQVKPAEAGPLYDRYMETISSVVSAVDALER